MDKRKNNGQKEYRANEYTYFPPDMLVEDTQLYEDDVEIGKIRKIHAQLKGTIRNSLSGFLRVCLVALLCLAQFVLVALAPFWLRGVTVYFYVILEIASIAVMLVLVNDNGSPSYRLAWISIVLVLPITGHLMYYLWGTTRGRRKLDNYIMKQIEYGSNFLEYDDTVTQEFEKNYPLSSRISKYLEKEGFPLYKDNQVQYFSIGELVFDEIFEELEKAQDYILIEFFIVAEGAIWDKMHDILLRKIKEGVEVKFLYDDFGAAMRTPKNFKKQLVAEGFEVQVFNPIHRYMAKLYMNYRTHQKIIVIDGKVGFTGGFNIADEYANLVERFGVWKDTGVKISGDGVWGLTVIFLQMWDICLELKNGHVDYERYRRKNIKEESTGDEGVYCHVLSDGPANNPSNPIENVYNMMIQYSGEYLYVMTPYLLIEDAMKDALIIAAKRGVDVRIITPSVPDKQNVNLLTKYNYGPLLKNGIKIYEYLPGFIHAKGILNEESAIVGTINMDYRSFYLHYENGVWMKGEKILSDIRDDFEVTFAMSREVTYEEWKNRPLWMKIIQPVWNVFATLM